MATIQVKYFGMAQEICGTSEEKYLYDGTLDQFLRILYQKYPKLNNPKIQIACNMEIIPKTQFQKIILQEKDEVVFLPPFAGG